MRYFLHIYTLSKNSIDIIKIINNIGELIKYYRKFTNTILLVYFYYENRQNGTKRHEARETLTEALKREKRAKERLKKAYQKKEKFSKNIKKLLKNA